MPGRGSGAAPAKRPAERASRICLRWAISYEQAKRSTQNMMKAPQTPLPRRLPLVDRRIDDGSIH